MLAKTKYVSCNPEKQYTSTFSTTIPLLKPYSKAIIIYTNYIFGKENVGDLKDSFNTVGA
ncbi:unnamed protein product [Sphenostylis stenocarpa]|uniref:Uncharacterized protein n=1 Tax=Sphenostylis stenocarpa TaxID=92480 RepID=A0AA86T3H5_9FABA|nr:unnamed protein product [Sphenostylis stenocarpa]